MSKGRLYGTSEIADRLGVTRQRAYAITRQKGFPEPYEELIMGSVPLPNQWVNQPTTRPDPKKHVNVSMCITNVA